MTTTEADGPYHEGEIAVQMRTSERDVAIGRGSLVRSAIMPSARAFLAAQRTVAVATLDELGRPWASLLSAEPGYVFSEEDGRTVHVRLASAPEDPVVVRLVAGAEVGMLAIDLSSRRRLRVNGTIVESGGDIVSIRVKEAFPNCPKYIQKRVLTSASPRDPARAPERGRVLDTQRRRFVAQADTLFVASRHPTRGVDVSHRGGQRGFVRALNDRTFRVPDYPGNSMFQTLGNFEVDARAGVVVVDFARGAQLRLTGTVSVSYGREDPDHPTHGTGRYWDCSVEDWLELPMSTSWSLEEVSPFNPDPYAG